MLQIANLDTLIHLGIKLKYGKLENDAFKLAWFPKFSQ